MAGSRQRAPILLALVVCACHTTRTVSLAPEAARALPEGSWIVLEGGERIQLADARVTADSLVGTRPDGTRIALPRARVASVEERRISAGRTAGLLSGVTLAVLAAFVALATAAGPGLP